MQLRDVNIACIKQMSMANCLDWPLVNGSAGSTVLKTVLQDLHTLFLKFQFVEIHVFIVNELSFSVTILHFFSLG